jgi:hypothetical protein
VTITTYRNFDLLIIRAGERYGAFVVDAPAGEASSFGQAIGLVRLQVRLGDLLQHAVEPLATAVLAVLLDVVQGAQYGNFLSHRQGDELVDRNVIALRQLAHLRVERLGQT